ncbi:MAG TPA: hypothetical protein VF816_00240 [Rhodocyclaceae bacterium]
MDTVAFSLPRAAAAWPSEQFAAVLKEELEQLPPAALPLQAGLSGSSYALGDRFSVMVISAAADESEIRARIGVFYEGLTVGCNCADDPTPIEPQNEYCEVDLIVDRASGAASARLA